MLRYFIMKFIFRAIGIILKISLFAYLGYYLLLFFLMLKLNNQNITIKNPSKYDKAYSIIKAKNKITHFPKVIPSNAKKVKMYCYTSDFNGEIFLLEFKIDKNYIEQELLKHKFVNIPKTGEMQAIYHFYEGNGIKHDGYMFYVIDDEENREYSAKYFPYFSGIGVNKNMDYILYYFFYPSD